MAIFSLRLTPIGKTTQKRPFTAVAHVRYITRPKALSLAMAERMPEQGSKAMRWLRQQEKNDRKNARVADKMIIALPRELSLAQQAELIRGFAEELTQGKASWFAAVHAKAKDRDNPHCHLIVRDRDILTGRRVVMFSAGKKELRQRTLKGEKLPTTLHEIRQIWENHANAALAAAGVQQRIDRRSLKEQGVERAPEVHEGPNIRAMHGRGYRPRSQDRQVRNRALRRKATPATRTVRYADIDKGRTRAEYNDALRRGDGALDLLDRLARQQDSPSRPVRDREEQPKPSYRQPDVGASSFLDRLAELHGAVRAPSRPRRLGKDRGRDR